MKPSEPKQYLVTSTELSPDWAWRSIASYWTGRRFTVVQIADGHPDHTQDMRPMPGERVVVDTLSTLGTCWRDIWPQVKMWLIRGASVEFLKEHILLENLDSEVSKALAAVADLDQAHHNDVVNTRVKGLARAAKEGRVNWKQPSRDELRSLSRAVKELGNVSAACKAAGISRKTYYRWRSEGLLS